MFLEIYSFFGETHWYNLTCIFSSVGLQGLIGLLVKLASGSILAIRTLFEINISSIVKHILASYDLSYGIPSNSMVDGQRNQVKIQWSTSVILYFWGKSKLFDVIFCIPCVSLLNVLSFSFLFLCTPN